MARGRPHLHPLLERLERSPPVPQGIPSRRALSLPVSGQEKDGSSMTRPAGFGTVERSKDRTTHMWVQDCMKVDAQVVALAGVLRRLGTKYKGADGVRTWHYFACPTRHGFPDCDKKCRDADAALKGVSE